MLTRRTRDGQTAAVLRLGATGRPRHDHFRRHARPADDTLRLLLVGGGGPQRHGGGSGGDRFARRSSRRGGGRGRGAAFEPALGFHLGTAFRLRLLGTARLFLALAVGRGSTLVALARLALFSLADLGQSKATLFVLALARA